MGYQAAILLLLRMLSRVRRLLNLLYVVTPSA